ncbi:hypothetical protein C1J01_04815 [Nonomuraea aridisoli]|uniref:Uncharacterized protein n=1 Tax=Nonomuraea aridisoli TaxID=2070368 RepID=A0A2W2EID8_9ACTN|nr:hypothetical protein C1J01_04815 [Nonomuraea aridisoli]
MDAEGVLADNGCESAVQLAYSASGGAIRAVQVIMSFPSANAARTAAARLANANADKAVAWRRSSAHSSYGYGKVHSGAYRNFVVVTIVTATRTAASKAMGFHRYLQADRGVYFLIKRDTAVTS